MMLINNFDKYDMIPLQKMVEQKDVITVLGAGYVGLTTAAILANCGYKTHLIEPNKERLNIIKTGKSFFYEDGLDKLISTALIDNNLIPTDSYQGSIPASNIIISCVGTPDNPDGSSNLSLIFESAELAAKYSQPGSIFVQKSTVPAGTGDKVIKIISDYQKDFAYVSNPEFLREGSAISDTLFFDRVVVGSNNQSANKKVLTLYQNIIKNRPDLCKITSLPHRNSDDNFFELKLSEAELVKVASNSFLALKISFANSIAKLTDQTDGDINKIMDAVGADNRIGRRFLNAGRGYGGGCFPKDVSGLISNSSLHGVEQEIMIAAQKVNDSMISYIANKAKKILNNSFKDKKIAILGLTFKANTSDTRKSPGIKLANLLDESGAVVNVYDPYVDKEVKKLLNNTVTLAKSIEQAIDNTDAVFIATDWQQFTEYSAAKYASKMQGKLFFDTMNVFDKNKVSDAGLHYAGVGRN